jgi:hypothetical protein
LLGSLPTPSTKELFLVVTKVAEGAPDSEFAVPTAPTAPEPFVPEVSTPVKLITVRDDVLFFERVAVTETLLNAAGANARQISEVPRCTFVWTTRTQVRPAPVTLFTTMCCPPTSSVEMNASNSSLADIVENTGEITLPFSVA